MTQTRTRSLPSQLQDEDTGQAKGTKVRVFAIFVMCLLIPGSFFLAGARFTPYRAFLLLAFLPLVIGFLRGAAGRITNVDVIIFLYGFWIGLAMIVHEGMERIDYVIIQIIEAMCGYLIGRVLIREAADYRLFFRCFFWGLLVILPFGIVEMLTKQNLVSQIAGMGLEPFVQATHPPRLGLYRAQTSFEHPILFGLFCSLGFANAFYIFRGEGIRRVFWTGIVFLTTFTAVSSAPLLAIMIQITMMTWDRIVTAVRSKWFLLVGLGALIFLVLEIATPNGAIDFLINNLTLVPATAEYRLMTIQYTINTVIENPFFGVGQGGDVDLPWWHTGSIDNFWLKTAVDYGIPSTLFLLSGMVLHLWRVMMTIDLEEPAASYRTGHFIAVAGLIFILVTVHLWGAANVMIMTYIGAGAWIYAPKKASQPARIPRPAARPEPEKPAGKPPEAPPLAARSRSAQIARERSGVRGSTGRYGGGQR